MSRIHLFELEDQSWLPDVIRDAGTGYLERVSQLAGHPAVLAPILADALRRSGETRIVDLCSGGSGPLAATLEQMVETEGIEATATLTDLYPNHGAFERLTRDHAALSAVYESVDATSVPSELVGLRTLINGFHHFRPELARRILENAVETRSPVAIFELVAPHPIAALGMFFAFFATYFIVPTLRPFRWGWIPLTYLFPVIPLFIFWDGFVSCLRCYRPRELREMTADLTTSDYSWEIGELELPGAPFSGSYMIGMPIRKSTD